MENYAIVETGGKQYLVEPGDIIEVEITDIGRLRNKVVEGEEPRAGIGHRPTDSEEVRRIALGNDDRLPDHLPKR